MLHKYNRVSTKYLYKLISNQFKRQMSGKELKQIFMSAVSRVQPTRLIQENVKLEGERLTIVGMKYPIKKPCHVLGCGKAALGMAVELENILKHKLAGGVLSVPKGIFDAFKTQPNLLPQSDSRLQFIEGATDNLPDKDAYRAAVRIQEYATKMKKDDLVIVLLSGGGSALLPLPKHPITLDEIVSLINQLHKVGADIREVNCIRKKLSQLKGGGLAMTLYPAQVVSLILSDVIGDSIDIIASGPTARNVDPSDASINVLKKYALYEDLPMSIKTVLSDTSGENSEAYNFDHVTNYLIGDNKMAAHEALKQAKSLGYESVILSTMIRGDVSFNSAVYAKLANEIAKLVSNSSTDTNNLVATLKRITVSEMKIEQFVKMSYSGKKICIIGAGESTTAVAGQGVGGRCQHMALNFAIDINKFDKHSTKISFLSCGTDGIDGPTDAAGAFVTSELVKECLQQNLDPEPYLQNCDSYNFFSAYNRGANLIKTGHTGTNVADIQILAIEPIQPL